MLFFSHEGILPADIVDCVCFAIPFYPRTWHCHLFSFLFFLPISFLLLSFPLFSKNSTRNTLMHSGGIYFCYCFIVFCVSYFLFNKQHVECRAEVYIFVTASLFFAFLISFLTSNTWNAWRRYIYVGNEVSRCRNKRDIANFPQNIG